MENAELNLHEICKQVETSKQISQAELARMIGMTPQSLCAVLKGRIGIPAKAAIELFDMTGIHPKAILAASQRIRTNGFADPVFLSALAAICVTGTAIAQHYQEIANLIVFIMSTCREKLRNQRRLRKVRRQAKKSHRFPWIGQVAAI